MMADIGGLRTSLAKHLWSLTAAHLTARLAPVAMLLAALPAHAGAYRSDSEVGSWIDTTFSTAIAQRHASGIAAAFVRDGRVVLLKGFGHSDLAGRIAVDPAATPFAIGSITKNFTGTCIAQLLERGLIHSLDDPANRYLRRIQLPRAFGREVSIRNLLDHRGGLDESVFGLATRQVVAVPITGDEIIERLPRIVRPPGEISVYSNIGYGVLGVLIEDVTGLTYPEYVRQNILRPLGMTHSFIRSRPSEPIAQPVAYRLGGSAEPVPQSWVPHPFIAPAGGLVSSAEDMAKFAIAHLDAERGLAPMLLDASTARLMHDRHTANAPYVAGFGMSFVANQWNGTRVTENAGSGPGFQAVFILLPDVNVGFVALIMGGSSAPNLRNELETALLSGSTAHSAADMSLQMFAVRESFLNFYLGPLRPQTAGGPFLPLERFSGLYRSERRPHVTSLALFNPGITLRVDVGGSSTLTINGKPGYRQIAPGAFWKPGVTPYVPDSAASDLYVFVPDADGRVKYVAPYLSVDVFRPATLDNATPLVIALLLCLICGTGLLALRWPVKSAAERWARFLSIALAVLALAMPVVVIVVAASGNPLLMVARGNVRVLQLLTVLATASAALGWALLLLGAAGLLGRVTMRLDGSAWSRFHLAVISVAGVALTFFLAHYNLVGDHIP